MTEPVLDAHAAAPRAPAVLRTSAALAARPDLVVCDECDAVHQRISLAKGTVARCHRCRALLGRGHVVRTQSLLAFTIAALLLIVVGNSAPIVTLDLRGVVSSATLLQAIQ